MGGDFNCIEADIDQYGHTTAACKAGAIELKQLRNTFNLHDAWRTEHKRDRNYTWYSNNLRTGSKLDKILIDKRFTGSHTSVIIPNTLSDHDYVKLTLQTDTTKRISHVWKLNTSILEDTTYTQQINNLIDTIHQRPQVITTPEGWDDLKDTIRHHTQRYTKQKRQNDKEHNDRLVRELVRLKRTRPTTTMPRASEKELKTRQDRGNRHPDQHRSGEGLRQS